jgi:surface polysaccharide O-acyltransferase-like enzyme
VPGRPVAAHLIESLGRISSRAATRPGAYLLALASVSALFYIPSAAVFKPWDWVQLGPFAFQPSFALVYVVYFFAGVALGTHGLERGILRPDGPLARRWAIWLFCAVGGFLLWIIPTALTVNGQAAGERGLELIAGLGFALCAASACLGWVAVCLRFATLRRPWIDDLSESAYGIYLVHYPFITWLQYMLLGAAMFAVAKAAIVFAGTLMLSWAVTGSMCRIPVGNRLVGAHR